MILLTTLRGDRFGLNPDLIEEIRANGTSCVVTMVTGRSYTAAEDIDAVQAVLHAHRVTLLNQAAQQTGYQPHHRAGHLAPVPDVPDTAGAQTAVPDTLGPDTLGPDTTGTEAPSPPYPTRSSNPWTP